MPAPRRPSCRDQQDEPPGQAGLVPVAPEPPHMNYRRSTAPLGEGSETASNPVDSTYVSYEAIPFFWTVHWSHYYLHSTTTGNFRQLIPGARILRVYLRREAAPRSKSTSSEVMPSLDRPTTRVSVNTAPVESSSRMAYSPGSIPTGKRSLTRSNFGGRCIRFP